MSQGSEARREQPTPVEVRAPKGARLLEVVWEDGASSLLPHAVLRAYCPCASCQGHQGPIQWTQGTEDLPENALELMDLREVGSYALALEWGDGHSTGIYTFRFLRELGSAFELSEAERRGLRFER